MCGGIHHIPTTYCAANSTPASAIVRMQRFHHLMSCTLCPSPRPRRLGARTLRAASAARSRALFTSGSLSRRPALRTDRPACRPHVIPAFHALAAPAAAGLSHQSDNVERNGQSPRTHCKVSGIDEEAGPERANRQFHRVCDPRQIHSPLPKSHALVGTRGIATPREAPHGRAKGPDSHHATTVPDVLVIEPFTSFNPPRFSKPAILIDFRLRRRPVPGWRQRPFQWK